MSLPAPPCLGPASAWARQALDFHPDPKQTQILDCADPRVIVLSSRQVGKSTVAAIRALYLAVSQPHTFVLLVGPVGAQAGEILAKARHFAAILGYPLRGDGNNPRSLKLPNGSRLVARPAVPESLRSYSKAALIIVDEAAWVSENAFQAMSPILAAANGSLWALSTPNGQNGRFYDLWHDAPAKHWTRFEIRAQDCPRLSPEFLAGERSTYGETFYAQEYDCQFLAGGLQFLSRSQIEALLVPDALAPGPCLAEKSEIYLGLDLGKRQDHTALVAVELTFQNGPKNHVTQSVPLLPFLTVRHVDRLALDSLTLHIPPLGPRRRPALRPVLLCAQAAGHSPRRCHRQRAHGHRTAPGAAHPELHPEANLYQRWPGLAPVERWLYQRPPGRFTHQSEGRHRI